MNDIQQQIPFYKSKLDWDTDISLLQAGDSKYFLNTIPADSEHMGVRTNCKGVSTPTIYMPNSVFTPDLEITVTETNPSTSTTRFEFTLLSVPNVLEIEVWNNNKLKYIYISGSGYSTVATFITEVISQVRHYFSDQLVSYGAITGGAYFVFNTLDTSECDMRVIGRQTATYPTTLSCIGAYYDVQDDITYFWVHDSANQVALLKYINYNNVIVSLFVTSQNLHSFVSNPFVIGTGKDKLLYWGYAGYTAHKINLYKALHNDVLYDESTSNIIKPPPFTDVAYSYSASVKSSDITRYFQLLVRNKYVDKENSVFGLLSELMYAPLGERSIGGYGSFNFFRSAIAVSADTHQEWNGYEYAVKYNQDNWRLTRLTDAGEVNNSDILSEVAPTDISRLFDYVPQRIGSINALNNNRMVLSDCVEGYDNVELDVSTTATTTGVTEESRVIYNSSVYGSGSAKVRIEIDAGATYLLYINTPTTEYTIRLVNDVGMTGTDVVDYFVDYINDNISDADITSAANGGTELLTITCSSTVTAVCAVFGAYTKIRSFPCGVNYLGIAYYDLYGRCGGVNISDDLAVVVSDSGGSTRIVLSISHQPPVWAYYYKIFYGLSNKQWYQQFLVKKDLFIRSDKYIKININECVLAGQIINPSFNIGSYVFNKGDRIKILQYITTGLEEPAPLSRDTYSYGVNFSTILDLEVLDQDETYIYVETISDTTVIGELDAANHYLVELYTPQNTKPIEYFETPQWGVISDPGTSFRYHDYFKNAYLGDTRQDQTASVPMVATLEGYDHWLLQTFYYDSGIPVSCGIISESFSNYHESKTRGLGRVNFYLPDANKIRRNIVRASNVYIPNTNINGLSTFEYQNEQTVDESYGPISDIKVTGDVLKIIQPHKISSIYLGYETGVDGAGNQILLRAETTLTPPRYNATKFGCMHPESVVVHGNYVYMLDAVNACVVRDTVGGTFAISENGMRSYFKYKTQQLVASCGYSFKAYGGYDYQNDLYFLTFKDPYNSTNDETIAFHEPSESWYSFYSFEPEMYCNTPGRELVSFSAGKLYNHSSTTRNTFYDGVLTNSEVWVVGNIYPSTPKKWNNIIVDSNDIWTAEDNGDVLIDAEAIVQQDPNNYTQHYGYMQSALKEKNFRYINGVFVADFMRDGTSSSSTFSVRDLINGRPLRGKTILVKLQNSNASAVYLKSVVINAQNTR
jgi:hypothetical protein